MEENEPKQRRPRTPNPAFSTPDQPTPQAKPVKAPPAVTFRPPAGDKTSSGTGTEASTAPPSPRPQRNPAKSTPRKATPQTPAPQTPAPHTPAPQPPVTQAPPPSRARAQAAAKSQQPRVEAAAEITPADDAPRPSAKAQEPAPAKATPAKRQPRKAAKTTPANGSPAKTTPAKAAPTAAAPANATPAKATRPEATRPEAESAEAAPNDATGPTTRTETTPAKASRRVKKAAATVKAAAAEIAPAVVTPDMSTVPDEQPGATPAPAPAENKTPAPAENGTTTTAPAPDREEAGNAPSARDELMPEDMPSLAAAVQERERATSPAAEPPATAPGQPGAAVPVGPTLPPAAAAVADTLSGIRRETWAALVADPGHLPELLALAATQTIGPRAKQWAGRTRAAYPGADPDALARLAVSQFTRFGSVSSIFAAVAGSYAPVALLGTAAFTHAELALHVAAAYGLDPTDRERAVDLLVLTRVHPVRDEAVAALAEAEQHCYENTGLTDSTRRLGRMVAVQAGGWAAVRVVNRFLPGTSLLVATLTSRGATRTMAARATAHYRVRGRAAVTAS